MKAKKVKINFANNLKLFRKSKNLSQAKLAEIIGVNQRTISVWEKGVCEPDFKAIEKLCELFDEDFNGLLG